MSKTRIVITEASITESDSSFYYRKNLRGKLIRFRIPNSKAKTKLVITEMKVVDGLTGNDLRIAKITPELIEFLKTVEIGVDDYFAILKAKEQQRGFRKLIETFRLYS